MMGLAVPWDDWEEPSGARCYGRRAECQSRQAAVFEAQQRDWPFALLRSGTGPLQSGWAGDEAVAAYYRL